MDENGLSGSVLHS